MDKFERADRVIFRGMETWGYGPTNWTNFSEANRAYIMKVARAAILVAEAEVAAGDQMVAVFLREMDRAGTDSVDQSDIDGALAALSSLAARESETAPSL